MCATRMPTAVLFIVLAALAYAPGTLADPPCPSRDCPNIDPQDEDESVLSPPTVEETYACGSTVVVTGFVPDAIVTLTVGTASPISQVGEDPDGLVFRLDDFGLPPLTPMDRLFAIQTVDGVDSPRSEEVSPVDPDMRFPDELPQPVVDPVPHYQCGRMLATYTIPVGATLEWQRDDDFLSPPDPSTLVSFEAAWPWQGVGVAPLPLGPSHRSGYGICGRDSDPSAPPEPVVTPPPGTLPQAIVVEEHLAPGAETVTIRDALFGATLTVFLNGDPTPWATGVRVQPFHAQEQITLPSPLGDGDEVEVAQSFCDAAVPTGLTSIVPTCADMTPAQILPPEIGDTSVTLVSYIPRTRIQVYADGAEIGDGGGRRVNLIRPIRAGETITVVQSTRECRASSGHVVQAACGRVFQRATNPVDTGPYQASDFIEYELPGEVMMADRRVKIRGRVVFPTEHFGPTDRLVRGASELPIVLIMHGNHAAARNASGERSRLCNTQLIDVDARPDFSRFGSYLGYDDLLRTLARSGAIAVSIDADDINDGSAHGRCSIEDTRFQPDETSQLYIEHLQYWRQLRDGTAPVDPFMDAFRDRVDIERVGLIGHSRGGERIPFAMNRAGSDFGIVTAIAVAPSINASAIAFNSSRASLLVLQGDRDGDVLRAGSGYFDDATAPMKSMIYIYGANHNSFNTTWDFDEFMGIYDGATVSDVEQRQLQTALVRLWMDAELFGRNTGIARDIFTGRARIDALRFDLSVSSYQNSTFRDIDLFENGNVSNTTLGTTLTPTGFDSVDELDCSSDFPFSCGHLTQYFDSTWSTPGGVQTHTDLGGFDASDAEFLTFRAGSSAPQAATTSGTPSVLNIALGNNGGPPSSSFTSTSDLGAAIPGPVENAEMFDWRRGVMRTVLIPLECLESIADEHDRSALSDLLFQDARDSGGLIMDDIGVTR